MDADWLFRGTCTVNRHGRLLHVRAPVQLLRLFQQRHLSPDAVYFASAESDDVNDTVMQDILRT